MENKIKWFFDPFPYAIVDNYLPQNIFQNLINEIDNNKYEKQKSFSTKFEKKTIFKDSYMNENVKNLVKEMGSQKMKGLIGQIISSKEILSMWEVNKYGGYSPYHVTENNGFLGSHIDHSFIENGKYSHVANTIFYASRSWQLGWGGETILFSKNGLKQKVLIDPIPNRLIIFVHSANSFHGVSIYNSDLNVERRTFYHDYYVKRKEIEKVMYNVNLKSKVNIKHTFHGTTFIPFFPFGIKNIRIQDIFSTENIKYLSAYFIYLINYKLGLQKKSLRQIYNNFLSRKFI